MFAEIELIRIWANPTLQLVSLGTGILGVVAGALGCFAVLRKQSLLGDAVSHAALPGVMLAFLLTRSKAPLAVVLGAAASGWLAALLVPRITRSSRIPIDTAMGGVMSVFFGIGILIQTYIQHNISDASQAGLDKFLFGQAATLLDRDVVLMGSLGAVALLAMLLFWKEFKLLSFDGDFAASLGLPIFGLNVLLTSLLVVAIVIGLQSVGVVLMSALVVAPGAAARQWTDRLGRMVALAAFFGGASGVIGTAVSDQWRGVATGPTIVLTATSIVLASLLFAPRRGLAWKFLRGQKSERLLTPDS